MKARYLVPITGAALLAVGGCGRKADVKSQLSELTNSFPSATATNAQQTDAAGYVNVALAAVRQNDYAGGVVALQTIQRMPNMTAEQLRAVQDTIQTLNADLVTRAANGDLKAKADLDAIERTRSQ